jgi:RHS repeat-associated protein
VGGGVTDIDFQVNTATNRLLAPTDTGAPNDKMRYDTAGNLIWDEYSNPLNPARDFGYDAENRVGIVKNAGGTELARYIYDPEGRRVRRIVGSTETWLVYGMGGELIAEYAFNAATVSPLKEYGYRGSQLLVVWDSAETGDRQWQWLVSDHLGSPRMVVDKSGNLGGIRRRDFLPFGEELASSIGHRTDANAGYTSDNVRQKFVGYERDIETGLDFAQARYFSNIQGRFTGVDPYNPVVDIDDEDDFKEYLGQPQHWNRYAYVWNNPLKYIDPDGEKVYVVTYTTGNSSGDDELRRAAETRAQQIQKSKGFDSKKDTVLLRGVKTKQDFENALTDAGKLEKTYGKVEQVSLFSHSGVGQGPVFHDSSGKAVQFTTSELASLKVNWSGSAEAKFYGCNTAQNFCQNFANAQGVPSYGYDRYAYFSSSPSKREGPNSTGPLYLIAADGWENGGYWRHIRGSGRVYPMVRRNPAPRPAPQTRPRR